MDYYLSSVEHRFGLWLRRATSVTTPRQGQFRTFTGLPARPTQMTRDGGSVSVPEILRRYATERRALWSSASLTTNSPLSREGGIRALVRTRSRARTGTAHATLSRRRFARRVQSVLRIRDSTGARRRPFSTIPNRLSRFWPQAKPRTLVSCGCDVVCNRTTMSRRCTRSSKYAAAHAYRRTK